MPPVMMTIVTPMAIIADHGDLAHDVEQVLVAEEGPPVRIDSRAISAEEDEDDQVAANDQSARAAATVLGTHRWR